MKPQFVGKHSSLMSLLSLSFKLNNNISRTFLLISCFVSIIIANHHQSSDQTTSSSTSSHYQTSYHQNHHQQHNNAHDIVRYALAHDADQAMYESDEPLVMSSAHGRPSLTTTLTTSLTDIDLPTESTFLDTIIAALNSSASENETYASSSDNSATDKSGLFDSVLENQPRNLASWLRDSVLGRAWAGRRQVPPQGGRPHNGHSSSGHNNGGFLIPANPYQMPPPRQGPPQGFGPLPHPGYAQQNGAPPNFVPNFLPAPDGFPSPYSPDSVMLDPQMMENTGIEYWLNFIEQQAANGGDRVGGAPPPHPGNPPQPMPQQPMSSSGQHGRPMVGKRPIGIGEKPMKSRPTSIRDELMLQDELNDDELMAPDMMPGALPPEMPTQPINNRDQSGRQPSMSPSSHNPKPEAQQPAVTNEIAPRCDKFTEHICVDDFEYPEQAIVDEVYKRREIFTLLYSDDGSREAGGGPPMVDGIPRDVEEAYAYESGQQTAESSPGITKKASGYVCPSEVLYGKPKLAKNRNGDWKVIVNAGEFTQTIRMEKCLKPNGKCNYIVAQMETRCAQVHSIHRLMVFEKGKGFFIDTFKIPTGCNCQIIRRQKNRLNLSHLGFSNQNQQPSSAQSAPYDDILNAPPRMSRPRPRPQGSSSRPQRPSANSAAANAQLSNTLWSILMGGDPGAVEALGMGGPPSGNGAMNENIAAQLGLLQHLKQNYPQLASQLSPDLVLQQLTGGLGGGMNRYSQDQNQQGPSRRKPSGMHDMSKYMFPGQTTTIVNPHGGGNGGGGNGAPVVQVIHVPVSSGNGHPQPVYKANNGQSPLFLGMQAYESKQNVGQVDTPAPPPANNQQHSYQSSPPGGYIASRQGIRYSSMATTDEHSTRTPQGTPVTTSEDEECEEEEPHVHHENDENGGGHSPTIRDQVSETSAESDEDPDYHEVRNQQNQQTDQRQTSNTPPPPSYRPQPPVDKRMLDKKINFNYHPILEYIATPPAA